MKKRGWVLLCLFLLHFFATAFGAGQSYYLDNMNGDDANDGRTTKTAWRSLDKLNNMKFEPDDHLYLKRDQSFEGLLFLKGSGKAGHSIKLSSYGFGKRPVIVAGKNDFAIKLLDSGYWEIEDVETSGGRLAGIFIGCTTHDLVMQHLRINNCYVHDIGDTTKLSWDYSKSTGGIIIVNGTFDARGNPVDFNSSFNDVVIEDCIVRYNHNWTCISVSSGKVQGKSGAANYIRNSTAAYSAADGIRMNGVRKSFIEYCVMYRNGAWPNFPGRNLGGLGAWFFDAEDCTIQFCEASHVQAATTDGGAFDIDYWQKNSTVQYCYGHDCSGYGVSVFGADASFPTLNSTVRYNVFSNNGRDSAFAFQGDFFVFTWNGGLLNGVKIHDNVSYWNPASNAPALKYDADFAGKLPIIFKNNSIYSKHEWLVSLNNNLIKCDSNHYWTTNGKPLWSFMQENCSLSEWQKNSGQDMHSRFIDKPLRLPSQYKAQLKNKPFRKNIGNSLSGEVITWMSTKVLLC